MVSVDFEKIHFSQTVHSWNSVLLTNYKMFSEITFCAHFSCSPINYYSMNWRWNYELGWFCWVWDKYHTLIWVCDVVLIHHVPYVVWQLVQHYFAINLHQMINAHTMTLEGWTTWADWVQQSMGTRVCLGQGHLSSISSLMAVMQQQKTFVAIHLPQTKDYGAITLTVLINVVIIIAAQLNAVSAHLTYIVTYWLFRTCIVS